MQEVLILQGLPGSGKTTFAKAWVKQGNPEFRRLILCKDDLGMELHGTVHKCEVPRNKTMRKNILALQEQRFKEYLLEGRSICVADTNLTDEFIHRITDWLTETGVQNVEVTVNDSFLDVPLMELLDRNAKRGCEMVPEAVLFEMYENCVLGRHFIPRDRTLTACVVFDMDGTLAEKGDRGIYEWDKVGVDKPSYPVLELANLYTQAGYKLVIASARQATDECVAATWGWLHRHHLPVEAMFMRKAGDSRRDWIVKEELVREILTKYSIRMWVDDRFQVVTHMRTLGIDVLQCKNGRY